MEILNELKAAGADLSRVIMCHMDRTIFTKSGALDIASTGCYMEYDLFGNYVRIYAMYKLHSGAAPLLHAARVLL